jgi:hypothetical protein
MALALRQFANAIRKGQRTRKIWKDKGPGETLHPPILDDLPPLQLAQIFGNFYVIRRGYTPFTGNTTRLLKFFHDLPPFRDKNAAVYAVRTSLYLAGASPVKLAISRWPDLFCVRRESPAHALITDQRLSS